MFHFFFKILLALLSLGSAQAQTTLAAVDARMAALSADAISKLAPRPLRSPAISAIAEKIGATDVRIVVARNLSLGELAAYLPGAILVDASLADASEKEIAFALAHELGHHRLQHWCEGIAQAIESTKAADGSTVDADVVIAASNALRTTATLHRQEREADAFAKKVLIEAGLWSAPAVKKALGKEPETSKHPSAKARLLALGA